MEVGLEGAKSGGYYESSTVLLHSRSFTKKYVCRLETSGRRRTDPCSQRAAGSRVLQSSQTSSRMPQSWRICSHGPGKPFSRLYARASKPKPFASRGYTSHRRPKDILTAAKANREGDEWRPHASVTCPVFSSSGWEKANACRHSARWHTGVLISIKIYHDLQRLFMLICQAHLWF